MRLPRMTTRRWMIAAAVVAVAFWGLHVRRQREAERRLVQKYEHKAQFNEEMVQMLMTGHVQELERSITCKLAPGPGEHDPFPSLSIESSRNFILGFKRQAAYFRQLAKKYEYAASHPWEPVTPDPPRP
jgi:hypothetical protein